MELIILFAICILITRSCLPQADGDAEPVSVILDVSMSAAYAVPLWVALVVIHIVSGLIFT